mgnify:CR=1 FL=1
MGYLFFICGFIFLHAIFMLYNYGAAILRAVGDTKRPLLFLIISGVTNAALNVVLVVCVQSGCGGGSDCNGYFPADFQCTGFVLSHEIGEQLPAASGKAEDPGRLPEADFSGWNSGRNPEHRDQSFQCNCCSHRSIPSALPQWLAIRRLTIF